VIRIAIILSIVLVLAWSAFWLISSNIRVGIIEESLTSDRNDGWSASYSSLDTGGYPSRVDVTIHDLVLTNTDRGIAWSLPSVQLLMLSYRNDHVVLALPETQTLEYRGQKITIDSERMRVSVELDRSDFAVLEQLIVEAAGIDVSGSIGQVGSVENFLFAIRQEKPGNAVYLVSLSSDAGEPVGIDHDRVNQGELVASLLPGLAIDSRIGLSRPISGESCSAPGTRLRMLDIDRLKLEHDWTGLELKADLEISEAGDPTGDVDFSSDNIGGLLAILLQLGIHPDIQSFLLKTILEQVGESIEGSSYLQFRIGIEEGQIRFGGFLKIHVPPIPPLC